MAQLILQAEYSDPRARRITADGSKRTPRDALSRLPSHGKPRHSKECSPASFAEPAQRQRGLLNLDLRQPEAVAIARLRCSQPGKGVDGHNDVLGLYRLRERHIEIG